MEKKNYVCIYCGFKCSSIKERKRCPDCNKHTMELDIEVESRPSKNKEEKVDVLGYKGRRPNFINEYVDDLSQNAADIEFAKNNPMVPTTSTRPSGIKFRNCGRCGNKMRQFTALDYLCPSCAGVSK